MRSQDNFSSILKEYILNRKFDIIMLNEFKNKFPQPKPRSGDIKQHSAKPYAKETSSM
jgi:hypothetical protein